jgi:two-component system response regulator RegX3
MARVLVVEDDPSLGAGLRDLLLVHGYEVDRAASGGEAIGRVAVRRYDLVLLDLMLPEMSGEELCRRWRREGLAFPIVILTAKGAVTDRVQGLTTLGADDYVVKPFDADELLARITAVLRRAAPEGRVTEPFRFAGVTVDLAALTAGGRPLTRLEGALVRYFAANPGRVIGRAELLARVWNEPAELIETRTVDVHLAKLRAKVEADPSAPRHLRTVRGEGYVYDPPGGAPAASATTVAEAGAPAAAPSASDASAGPGGRAP